MRLKDLISLGEKLGYQIVRSDNHPDYQYRKCRIFMIYRNGILKATFTHTAKILEYLNKNN